MIPQQVKSKQRVADHGEVFTNEREVNAMLDLVWKNLEQGTTDKILTATFLEPACGSGNFLVEILERKLEIIKELDKKYKSQNHFQKNIITALASIYGVELLEDNAQECRESPDELRHIAEREGLDDFDLNKFFKADEKRKKCCIYPRRRGTKVAQLYPWEA